MTLSIFSAVAKIWFDAMISEVSDGYNNIMLPLCNQWVFIVMSTIWFWIFILRPFMDNLFDAVHSYCIINCCCWDVVKTVFIIDWFLYIWRLTERSHLFDYFFCLSSRMLSITVFLKPAVPDVGWLLRQSSSCWVMNREKIAYILSLSRFNHQILSV